MDGTCLSGLGYTYSSEAEVPSEEVPPQTSETPQTPQIPPSPIPSISELGGGQIVESYFYLLVEFFAMVLVAVLLILLLQSIL